MKKYILYISVFAVALIAACTFDAPTQYTFDAYTWSGKDETAGNWDQVHVSAKDKYPVATPNATSDAAYLAEVADLKTASSNLTAEQQDAIEYWGANSMVRWNEIARYLMAKYNLLPAPNEDETYSFPDATHPDQYPLFPFSSPPFASRAYAYLSVATYDALIACWHYKYTYNRPAPYTIDATISRALPDNGVPSYPSEDAVISEVSLKILSALFPLEKEYLKAKAQECNDVRIWAGMNVQSDIDAAKILADSVAAAFTARMKTDRMGKVTGTQAQWDSLATYIADKGEIPYESLEIPKRPPLGFFFGNVKTWVVDAHAMLPPAPPSTSSAEFQAEIDNVKSYTQNPTRENIELANFWADGPGSYAPPGHWNRFAIEEILRKNLNPIRTARVLAYMNMAVEDGGISCWHAKYTYFVPRPATMDKDIHPLLGTPPFPAYTSGHSVFSSAAATVLAYFFPDRASAFEQMAAEAGLSRIVSGIHYKMDADEGIAQGKNVGNAITAVAALDGAE